MLELNDIQCWVTTKDNVTLPEIRTYSGEPNVVTSTAYIIHWFSKAPLTALCEIHTRNPYGEISKAVATCEMDAAMPWTQRRSSTAHTHSGRNLRHHAFGTAWLEIRRATSFSVTEMVPYVTFMFNFELIGPEGDNSPSARQQRTPLATQALSLGINNPSSALAYSLLQTSPGSSSAPCAPPPSSPASDSMGGVPSTSPNSYPFRSSSTLPNLRKRPRPDPSPSPPQTDDQLEHSMKLGSVIQKLVAIQGKEEYCEPGLQEWAQTLDRIRSAELECGSLSPGKSFFEYWTSTYDSDEDGTLLLNVELQELRKHLSGLGEKIYRQREAKLARLQVNIQDANVAAALNSTSDCSSKADFWLC
ncbi:hypothetical protein JB92DRAFT_2994833 [Gautieria morchelliformis]|nr:hypothetical protein JB92DRAFT_2994833 [Gautieria morchelliformis]